MVTVHDALNNLKSSLETNLTDIWETAGGNPRAQWVYYDEPTSYAKYPIIEIKKLDNPKTVISMGPNYTSSEYVFANLWVYTKNGFKATVSGTEYLNSRMVEYLLGHIEDTIKNQFSTLHTSNSILVTAVNSTPGDYDTETQLYFGALTVRIWFFRS